MCSGGLETGTYVSTVLTMSGRSGNCGTAAQVVGNCINIAGYVGASGAAATRCAIGSTSTNFQGLALTSPFAFTTQTTANCSVKTGIRTVNVWNGVANTKYAVVTTASQNIFTNMRNWADAIAARTISTDSQFMFNDEKRGSMWIETSWLPNNSFATRFANIDWSGIAVMTTDFYSQQNEFGYSRGTTLVTGKVYYNAGHYNISEMDCNLFFNTAANCNTGGTGWWKRAIFLTVNNELIIAKPMNTSSAAVSSVSPLTNTGTAVFYPNPWYSDDMFGQFEATVATTVGTFPVPKLGSNSILISRSTDTTWSYGTYLSSTNLPMNWHSSFYTATYTPHTLAWAGQWGCPATTTTCSVVTTTAATFNAAAAVLNNATNRAAVAPFYVAVTGTGETSMYPVYLWNANKAIKLSWTTFDSLTKPMTDYNMWYRNIKKLSVSYTPSSLDSRKHMTLIYKTNTCASNYCSGKYNLAKGNRKYDSGSPAFIIAAGRPMLIGALLYTTYPYTWINRDENVSMESSGLTMYSGITSISSYYQKFALAMVQWGQATTTYQPLFCGFLGTPALAAAGVCSGSS